jgi:hypothetical protein
MNRKGKPMKTLTSTILMLCIVAAVSGCSMSDRSAFRWDAIPQDRYIVGGGWNIDFTAPASGTAVLVEMSTRRLIETKSMAEGDTYRQSFDPGQSELKDMGIEPKWARFQLYFVPAEAAKSCPNAGKCTRCPKAEGAWTCPDAAKCLSEKAEPAK